MLPMPERVAAPVGSFFCPRPSRGSKRDIDLGQVLWLGAPIHGVDQFRLGIGNDFMDATGGCGAVEASKRCGFVAGLLALRNSGQLATSFRIIPATPSERVQIAKAIEDELKATERRGRPKADAGTSDMLGETDIPVNSPEIAGKETRQVAAEKAGFGNPETYRQAKTVTEKAEPELIEAMDREEIAIEGKTSWAAHVHCCILTIKQGTTPSANRRD